MGISIRAYARHRGVSDTAVRKAIKTGRITKESDGSIDIEKADKEWQINTESTFSNLSKTVSKANKPKSRPISQEAMDAVDDTLKEKPGSTTTYVQARTANEILKAQTQRVKLAELKKELVNRDKAVAHVFRLAREERDAWQRWPSRIAAEMASQLAVDQHTLHTLLDRYVLQHLSELADITVTFDGR
ncbi:elements of external origin [Agarilytica rhodophyticola]|uniref:elements of external origin n=1 Tax=Agarilytica rhodophyticola TaxID=1737490 RepID=UPI000B34269D|nr:elements of external origin [Agarilytica rhodophyticola]